MDALGKTGQKKNTTSSRISEGGDGSVSRNRRERNEYYLLLFTLYHSTASTPYEVVICVLNVDSELQRYKVIFCKVKKQCEELYFTSKFHVYWVTSFP